ncbi:DUF3037 domain-containing protein [Hymenobacter sp. BT770]|uniref:DUF3037 domain-containing protein n=1 Tax=Hymenobacter sp. BT770 TaxID=2886942 RepID=UPI001D1125E4|nr:DUF3037 domain-containing protein [Hymenobacter sp. BT770]MCC3152763.1 DUF3037 domain-containing protein [Hymenobacter sp. BT770]MDO3414838.1 DUF3037 domain-containing protein [Hymenobacter sp. BT770]
MKTIYFSLLKYVHSPFLGEEVNVAILLYFPEQERMEFRFPDSFRRIRQLYPDFSERQLKVYLTAFRKRVTQENSVLKPVPSLEQFTTFITRELLAVDATVLQFGPPKKALAHTSDTVEVAQQYYDTFFRAVQERPRHKDDDFLRRQFNQLLAQAAPAAAKLVLRDVEVPNSKTSVKFDAAWQNGTFNYVKAISFDLVNPTEINRKSVYCHGWLDLVGKVPEIDNYRFDLLVAPPSRRELYGEYEKALNILNDTSAPKRIITEGQELVEYSEQAAHYLIEGTLQ